MDARDLRPDQGYAALPRARGAITSASTALYRSRACGILASPQPQSRWPRRACYHRPSTFEHSFSRAARRSAGATPMNINDLLKIGMERKASDLHLKVGSTR
jgi:hypothetical protein